MDKDNRAAIVALFTAVGSIFIAGYYLSLDVGFTPDINLGQATFLLFQAFFVGGILVSIIIAGIFAPAFAYRMLSIDIESLSEDEYESVKKPLMHRSIVAQVFFLSLCFSFASYPRRNDLQEAFYWAIAVEICIFSAVVQFLQPRIAIKATIESRKKYWLSVCAIWILGAISFFILWILYSSAEPEKRVNDFQFFSLWATVALYSAIMAVFKKTDVKPAAILAFTLFLFVLSYLNVLTWPFKVIAYKIGIAERNPITLIVPKESCPVLRSAMTGIFSLHCDGEKSGVMENVMLLNSLGSRWVIKIPDKETNIIFDGKGVVIRHDKVTSSN